MTVTPSLFLSRLFQRFITWSDQTLNGTAVKMRRRPRNTRVTHAAVLHRPCDLSVMTGAAKLAVDDLGHIDLVAARLELKSQIGVTYLAPEPDPVKPVREDNRPHARSICIV